MGVSLKCLEYKYKNFFIRNGPKWPFFIFLPFEHGFAEVEPNTSFESLSDQLDINN